MFSKTVYSICYPQTQSIINSVLSQDLAHLYTHTYTNKQNDYHRDFFDSWKRFSKVNVDSFRYFYPTAGSSEAIREQIVYLHSQQKTLATFYGEYEGYMAIAKAVGMPYIQISRDNWRQEVKLLPDNCVFFLSEPSSIDGNAWRDFYDFLNTGITVYLDLTYYNSVNYSIDISNYTNIEGVFFSLSKVFGTYYHRIGGVVVKNENPLLYGNMWFKNILSMRIGCALMDNLDIYKINEENKKMQMLIVERLNQQGYNVQSSDVALLVTTQQNGSEWQKEYIRYNASKRLRLCITPLLEKEIRNEKY